MFTINFISMFHEQNSVEWIMSAELDVRALKECVSAILHPCVLVTNILYVDLMVSSMHHTVNFTELPV
jgi:hypothetical protein